MLIKTNAQNFIRRVEIRGSDNGKDQYVVRLDALIADQRHPLGLSSLQIAHPLNNFQYLHLRILDEGKPHVPIESVSCFPPAPEDPLAVPLSAHIMENRTHPDSRSTVVVVDLGERRFPVTEIDVDIRADRFVKKAIFQCASSPAASEWQTIFEGTFYRLKKDEVVKELTRAHFDPQPARYVRIELSGKDATPAKVDKIDARGSMPMVLFRHTRGEEYSIYYNNPLSVNRKPAQMPFAGGPGSYRCLLFQNSTGPRAKDRASGEDYQAEASRAGASASEI